MSAEKISSKIWKEIPEPDNPFAASVCYCHGYDVYGEILRKATWIEYLFLLFTGERPTDNQSRLLEVLAIALANPGPRDHSVSAAMTGGAGGSTNASSLMAALAVGAGRLAGAREVRAAMDLWGRCENKIDSWIEALCNPIADIRVENWPPIEHPPGFDPNGVTCPKPVTQILEYLSEIHPHAALGWLTHNRLALEKAAGHPLSLSGVSAAAFVDLGFGINQGEMLYLLLRLPGAAAHALEQQQVGWRKFPFFKDSVVLIDNPGPKVSKSSS